MHALLSNPYHIVVLLLRSTHTHTRTHLLKARDTIMCMHARETDSRARAPAIEVNASESRTHMRVLTASGYLHYLLAAVAAQNTAHCHNLIKGMLCARCAYDRDHRGVFFVCCSCCKLTHKKRYIVRSSPSDYQSKHQERIVIERAITSKKYLKKTRPRSDGFRHNAN